MSFFFLGLTLATIVFGFIRNMFLFNVLVRCAQSLHDRMFTSILRTPVRFFDINPIGKFHNHLYTLTDQSITFLNCLFSCMSKCLFCHAKKKSTIFSAMVSNTYIVTNIFCALIIPMMGQKVKGVISNMLMPQFYFQ